MQVKTRTKEKKDRKRIGRPSVQPLIDAHAPLREAMLKALARYDFQRRMETPTARPLSLREVAMRTYDPETDRCRLHDVDLSKWTKGRGPVSKEGAVKFAFALVGKEAVDGTDSEKVAEAKALANEFLTIGGFRDEERGGWSFDGDFNLVNMEFGEICRLGRDLLPLPSLA